MNHEMNDAELKHRMLDVLRRLRAQGLTASDLMEFGADPNELREIGFTPQELRDAGATPQDPEKINQN